MRFIPAYVVIFVFAVLLGTVSRQSLADAGSAGSGSALVSGTGAGSAVVTVAPGSGSQGTVTTVVTAPVIHDPVADPGATISDLEAAKRVGWVALVFAILVIASRLAGRVGASVKWLSWLGKGKWAVVVGAVGSLALAGYNALVLGGSWYALLAAMAVAAAALHDPNATEEPAPGTSTTPKTAPKTA